MVGCAGIRTLDHRTTREQQICASPKKLGQGVRMRPIKHLQGAAGFPATRWALRGPEAEVFGHVARRDAIPGRVWADTGHTARIKTKLKKSVGGPSNLSDGNGRGQGETDRPSGPAASQRRAPKLSQWHGREAPGLGSPAGGRLLNKLSHERR